MKKILIAHDDKNICTVLKYHLEEQEYEIHFAHDGKETLKRIYTVSPDLLIMDINISGMTGHEICQIVRQDKFFRDLPIIAISGDNQSNKELDVTEIMTKPLDMESFLQKVENILSE